MPEISPEISQVAFVAILDQNYGIIRVKALESTEIRKPGQKLTDFEAQVTLNYTEMAPRANVLAMTTYPEDR